MSTPPYNPQAGRPDVPPHTGTPAHPAAPSAHSPVDDSGSSTGEHGVEQPPAPSNAGAPAASPQPAVPPAATGVPPYGQAPYGQAPYGQAPYGQAPYGQPPQGQHPAAGSATLPKRLGTVALIAGIATIALILISTVVELMMLSGYTHSGDSYGFYSATTLLFTVVKILFALVAVVCGIAGLVAKGRPRGAAGVGLGIGLAMLATSLLSVMYSSLYSLFVR